MALVKSEVWTEYKDEEGFLAAWADIIAGAMMKEKASAHFVRNDGGGGWRVEKCRVTSGEEKKEEEGFIARTTRFLRQVQTIRESVTIWDKGASK